MAGTQGAGALRAVAQPAQRRRAARPGVHTSTALAQLMEGVEPGSHRAREFREAAVEAEKLCVFFEGKHPGWFGESASSGIRRGAARETAIRILMRCGKAYLLNARTVVQRYDAWAERRAGELTSGGYPPTRQTCAWFVEDEQQGSKAKDLAAGRAFAGTVGRHLVKSLGYARSAVGAPFSEVEARGQARLC
jgi:hypothetical protein